MDSRLLGLPEKWADFSDRKLLFLATKNNQITDS